MHRLDQKLIEQKHLERILNETESSHEQNVENAALLLEHRFDKFTTLSECETKCFGAPYLRVFKGKDQAQTPMFLALFDSGDLFLGRIEDLAKEEPYVKAELKGWDRLKDEIISVTVTGKHHFSGYALGLWIVVNKSQENPPSRKERNHKTQELKSQTGVYHALVGINEAKEPFITPVSDKYDPKTATELHFQNQTLLPDWVKNWNYRTSNSLDPFQALDNKNKTLYDQIKKVHNQNHANIHQIYQGNNFSAITLGNTVHLFMKIPNQSGFNWSPHSVFMMQAKISSVALYETKPQDAKKPTGRLYLACNDRQLVILELFNKPENQKQTNIRIHQTLTELPRAVELVPQLETEKSPDVLIAYTDGQITLLKDHIESGIRQHLENMFQRLSLNTVSTALESFKKRKKEWFEITQQSPEPRNEKPLTSNLLRLSLFRAVQLLHRLPKTPKKRRMSNQLRLSGLRATEQLQKKEKTTRNKHAHYLNELQKELDDTLHDSSLVETVEYLKNQFAKSLRKNPASAKGAKSLTPSSKQIKITLPIIHSIYFKSADLPIQDDIDTFFRTIHNLTNCNQKIKKLDKLFDHSKENRDQHVEELKNSINIIHKTNLLVERWADVFWKSDQFRLKAIRNEAMVGLTCLITRQKDETKRCLVLLTTNKLALFPISKENQVKDLTPQKSISLRDRGDYILCHFRLPSEDTNSNFLPYLVVGGISGNIYLYKLETPGNTFDLRIVDTFRRPTNVKGAVRTISAVRTKSGWHLAASYNLGRKSTLVWLKLTEGTFNFLYSNPFETPRVRSLALGISGKEQYFLIKGALFSGIARMAYIEGNEKNWSITPHRENLHEIETGVTTVSVDNALSPQYALVADHSGYIWCRRISDKNQLADTKWCYRLKGGVSGAVTVKHKGDICFLVGSNRGELALIRVRDGLRIWKHRWHQSIQALACLDPERGLIGVGFSGGEIALLTQNLKPENYLEEARKNCRSAREFPPEGYPDSLKKRANSNTKLIVDFFKDPKQNKETHIQWLTHHKDRTLRTRYLKLLSRVNLENWCHDPLLKKLSLRELGILLNYLPKEQFKTKSGSSYLNLIGSKIIKQNQDSKSQQNEKIKKNKGDNSTAAQMSAFCAYLIRLEALKPSTEELIELGRNHHLLKHTWCRKEFSRLLLLSIEREKNINNEQGPELLDNLFPYLLKLPLNILTELIQACHYQANSQLTLKALQRICQTLITKKDINVDDLKAFVGKTNDLKNTPTFTGLLATLASFYSTFLRQSNSTTNRKPNTRINAENTINDIYSFCHFSHSIKKHHALTFNTNTFSRTLINLFAQPRHSTIQQPIEKQHKWWESFKKDLAKFHPQEVSPINDWQVIELHLVNLVKLMLSKIIENELTFLSTWQRPYISVKHIDRDERDKVHITLDIRADGDTALENSTLIISAEHANGLEGPGELQKQIDTSRFDSSQAPFTVELSGFVAGTQNSLNLYTILTGKELHPQKRFVSHQEDVKYSGTWRFNIPSSSATGHIYPNQAFKELNSKAYQHFFEKASKTNYPLQFIAIDKNQGMNTFLSTFQRKTNASWLDLDREFSETTINTKYIKKLLQLQTITEKAEQLDKQNHPNHQGQTTKILIGPIDRTVAHIATLSESSIIKDWIKNITNITTNINNYQYTFVCDHQTVQLLIQKGLAYKHTCFFDQSVNSYLSSTHTSKDELQSAFKGYIKATTRSSTQEASNTLDKLGSNPRFISDFVLWKRNQNSDHGLAQWISTSETTQKLMNELKTLSTLQACIVLIASWCKSRIPEKDLVPGMTSAQSVIAPWKHSNSKSENLLISPDERLSQRSIYHLSLHKRRQSRKNTITEDSTLTIHGLSHRNILVTHSIFEDIINLENSTDIERHFHELVHRGFGELNGTIFRTREPFLSLIKKTRSSIVPAPNRDQDFTLFQKIFGKDRFPLEHLTMFKISRLNKNTFANLFKSRVLPTEIHHIHQASELWKNVLSQQDFLNLLSHIFPSHKRKPLDFKSSPWELQLKLKDVHVVSLGDSSFPECYAIWFPESVTPHFSTLDKAIDDCISSYRSHLKNRLEEQKHILNPPTSQDREIQNRKLLSPRIYLLGPGAEDSAYDPYRRSCVLKIRDLVKALWIGQFEKTLTRNLARQLRLTNRSPYHTSGALPPGSPIFVGRKEEVEYIQRRIRDGSILIVGSRRVGKTSLLNRILDWADGEPDLFPVFVDLQGVKTLKRFESSFKFAIDRINPKQDLPRELTSFTHEISHRNLKPLFLINEIDGLVDAFNNTRKTKPINKDTNSNHPPKDFIQYTLIAELLQTLRMLNDHHLARFVMVGYATLASLGDVESPFYHWTEGTAFDRKALPLYELSDTAAQELLDLLQHSDLELTWVNEQEKDDAYQLCLEQSYRIPWIVQLFGQLIVEEAERQRTDELTLNLVKQALKKESHIVWKHIESIHFSTLVPDDMGVARDPGFRLILYCLAKHFYFDGGSNAPIHCKPLRYIDPIEENLIFNVTQAKRILEATISDLFNSNEKIILQRWLQQLKLDIALRLLTLTLLLKPHPDLTNTYCFLLHILPLEMHAYCIANNTTPTDMIIIQAVRFLDLTKIVGG